jgi:serine/threonine-protein kinase
MFLDEARLAAQLTHPNIAQVFDIGQIGEDYFYTMEFVHGADVLDLLARTSDRDQRVPLNVALAIAAGTAAGLAHAHDRCGANGRQLGIVHRDISPSNLMVSFEGAVKVLDFGVAKARYRSQQTQAGQIMGKVAYLSPEQCKTGRVDHRSDIFSLGIVLYELLTHTRPFKRDTDYETLAAVVRHTPARPSLVVDGLPRKLDNIVMRALAKDPEARFVHAIALVEAIEEITEELGLKTSPSVLRRYMRETFGDLPEPWRMAPRDIKEQTMQYTGELFTDAGTGFTLFPLNATATDVPLLPKTSAIDLDALFPRTHSIAIGSDEIHDAAPAAVPAVISQSINTPRPARKPTEPPPLPAAARVSGRMAVQPSGSMPVVHLPAVQMPRPTEGHTAIVTPYTRRRSWVTVGATALLVLVFGIGTYLLLSSGDSSTPAAAGTPTVHAPPTVTPIPRPTATPIEVAKPVEKPPEIDPNITIEPTAPPAPAPAPSAVVAPARVAPTDTPAPPPAAKKKACTDPLDCQF